MSREYASFLRDENAGNPMDWNAWGEKLYAAWEKHGRSAPALIDSLGIDVTDTLAADVPDDARLPSGYRLDPAYPNPFNSTVSLRFALPVAGPGSASRSWTWRAGLSRSRPRAGTGRANTPSPFPRPRCRVARTSSG